MKQDESRILDRLEDIKARAKLIDQADDLPFPRLVEGLEKLNNEGISQLLKTYTQGKYAELLKENKQMGMVLIMRMFIPINIIRRFFSQKIVPLFPWRMRYAVKNKVYNKKHDE